ncbi:MAG: hypothetical protein AAGA58_19785 [Verrucomicrobiota bacterium]
MKTSKSSSSHIWLPVIAAVLSLGVTSCSKKEEAAESVPEPSEPKTEAPVEEKKPEPKVVEKPKAPAPKPEPKPEPKPAKSGGSIAKQLVGYWGADEEKMLQIILAQAPAGAGPEMENQAKMMIRGLVLNLRGDGTGTMNTPEGPEEAKYSISDENAATGEFTMNVDPENDDPSSEPARVNGDQLTLTAEGQELHFVRISASEYEKRPLESQKAMQEMMQKMMQQAMPEGLELPEGLPPEIQNQIEQALPEGIELPPGVQIPGAE